jgi:hypothetical protein
MFGTEQILNYSFPIGVPAENIKFLKSGDTDNTNHYVLLIPLKEDSELSAVKFGSTNMISGGYLDGVLFSKSNILAHSDINTITVSAGAFMCVSLTKVQ